MCYCIEGHVIDRKTSQNGRGWAEGYAHTLNATDRHGVVYPINMMVGTRGGRDDMRTCFGIGKPGDPQFTICATRSHAVCYAVHENGSQDVRLNEETAYPITTGGG